MRSRRTSARRDLAGSWAARGAGRQASCSRLLLAFALLGGCARAPVADAPPPSSATPAPAPNAVYLDLGRSTGSAFAPITLPMGGRLSVGILSGMDSGFVVRLTSISPPGVLKADGEYDADNAASREAARKGWVGADKDRIFVFRAVKPGRAFLAWRARRGDYDRGPDDIVLKVTVTKANGIDLGVSPAERADKQ